MVSLRDRIKAHRRVCHSALGSRVIENIKKNWSHGEGWWQGQSHTFSHTLSPTLSCTQSLTLSLSHSGRLSGFASRVSALMQGLEVTYILYIYIYIYIYT